MLLVLVLVISCFTGCGSSSKTAQEKNPTKINFLVWDSTVSESLFKDFEKKYNIKVVVSYINNTDEILSKLINGEGDYDLIDLEGAYVNTFVKNKLLEKIDFKQIPNSKHIDKSLKSIVGDEKGQYIVPMTGGNHTMIIYNKKTCPIKITSFKDLANPKLKNKITMVKSTNTLFGTALESLGYKASSTNESEIKQAYELLKKIKPNVKVFVDSTALPQLQGGDCSVALSWDWTLLMTDKKNWGKYGLAQIDSGYEYFRDTFAIPKGTKRKAAAEKLINFYLEKTEYAKTLKEYPAIPFTKDASYLPSGYLDSPAFEIPSVIEKKYWVAPVNDKQVELFDKYYTKLMS